VFLQAKEGIEGCFYRRKKGLKGVSTGGLKGVSTVFLQAKD